MFLTKSVRPLQNHLRPVKIPPLASKRCRNCNFRLPHRFRRAAFSQATVVRFVPASLLLHRSLQTMAFQLRQQRLCRTRRILRNRRRPAGTPGTSGSQPQSPGDPKSLSTSPVTSCGSPTGVRRSREAGSIRRTPCGSGRGVLENTQERGATLC